MSSCNYKVKPLPSTVCSGCGLNGCYPWNINPLLFCSQMGGMVPAFLNSEPCCLSYKPAETMWDSFIEDRKAEAKRNEETRQEAVTRRVYTNSPLPAETASPMPPDMDELNSYEREEVKFIMKHNKKHTYEEALKIYIDSGDCSASELSPYLATYARLKKLL